MTTIIGQLLEKLAEVEQRLEISDKTAYNEGNDDPNQMFISFENTEEIYLPDEEEYARALQTLYTWLENAPQFVKSKVYIRKEIQTTEYDNAYIYTFKKDGENYILVDKVALDE